MDLIELDEETFLAWVWQSVVVARVDGFVNYRTGRPPRYTMEVRHRAKGLYQLAYLPTVLG